MFKSIVKKYKKEDNKFKGSSRKITSFYSSLIAGLFVATGFIFVSFFIPLGQSGWGWSWANLGIYIIAFCFIYYVIGLLIISGMNSREIYGYKMNFLSALIGTLYISIIILFKLRLGIILLSTLVISIISFVICHKIASNKYNRHNP
jgi:hypothetical protein